MSSRDDTQAKPSWADDDPKQWSILSRFMDTPRQWVYVYRSWGDFESFPSGAEYSALLPPERIEAALSDPDWEVHIGAGGYGFTQWYDNGEATAVYEKYPDEGPELLVVRREFHCVRESSSELVEEFRLLFNLWEDRNTRTYYYFDGSGNPIKAAVIEDRGVRILWSLLRRYQAAKQMYLALYIDSSNHSPELPKQDVAWTHSDEHRVVRYNSSVNGFGDDPYSNFMGKRLFAPPPREECGLPPFEKQRTYEEFIIGLDMNGNEVTHTSDPDRLANYFGANPDSPHYLTPVYFSRDVLNKYFAASDRYTVEDGYIRCAGLWGLRLDNDQPNHVMVFLGDLGRDIPLDEARYWRSFNTIPSEEGPSSTLIKRAFRAEFTDPQSADLRFSHIYIKANKAWERAMGFTLFRPLHADDEHLLNKLHVPAGDTPGEFDEQILNLAKLVVDSINEEAILGAIGKGPKDEKGLAKLERFLASKGIEDARQLLGPFARVQGLRSRGAAHTKGSDFDISVALGGATRREGFRKLLGEAIETLEALLAIAGPESAETEQPTPTSETEEPPNGQTPGGGEMSPAPNATG